jgi:hypothetical protein
MNEQYRLVFSGEVAEGQHPAVVRKRLQAILKLGDERMELLFSGKAVVIKRAVDETQAARFQQAFDKAGAALRVVPLQRVEQAPSSDQAAPGGTTGDFSVLPAGSDLLTDAERPAHPSADIDTGHLSVKGATFIVDDEPAVPADVPSVDHLSLADPGTVLGDATEVVVAEISAEFDLAEVGAILSTLDDAAAPNPVDVDALNFEVADRGADLGGKPKPPPPPPPDTSHITLDDD